MSALTGVLLVLAVLRGTKGVLRLSNFMKRMSQNAMSSAFLGVHLPLLTYSYRSDVLSSPVSGLRLPWWCSIKGYIKQGNSLRAVGGRYAY